MVSREALDLGDDSGKPGGPFLLTGSSPFLSSQTDVPHRYPFVVRWFGFPRIGDLRDNSELMSSLCEAPYSFAGKF